MQSANNGLQHVNVKFFIENADALDWNDAIGVFHRWIQESKLDGLLIDVADYRHVPEGPGVLLVAHEAIYSLDNIQGRLGVLYNRRTSFEGGAEDAIADAIEKARNACRLLAVEECFQGKLDFSKKTLQIVINDRHFASNTEDTLMDFRPAMEAALSRTLGPARYSFQRAADPRSRFLVDVSSDKEFQV